MVARGGHAERRLAVVGAFAKLKSQWACSSVGRAPRSQRGGRRFEPGHVHQVLWPGEVGSNLDHLRDRLQGISDADLIVFGKQMRGIVYPLSYDWQGKPVVSAFSIQLEEARAEWRQRHPKP